MTVLDRHVVEVEKKALRQGDGIILVETNRWQPDRCMWTVEKVLLREGTTVVFPFPTLSESICHVFVGTTDSHKCFIHLTPLTSLFRRSTDELEKISANLKLISTGKQNWRFGVYFFSDNDNEVKFRNIISEVLGRKNVSFFEMKPKGYKLGEINLLYQMNNFFYSTQDATLLLAHRNTASMGFYNSIPIYAYE